MVLGCLAQRCMAEATLSPGRKRGIVDVAAWSAASWVGDAAGVREETPACSTAQASSEGSGIQGKHPHPQSSNSQEETLPAPYHSSSHGNSPSGSAAPSCSISLPQCCPQVTVGQAGAHSPQLSKPACDAGSGSTSLALNTGLQGRKGGGTVQTRGSQVERAAWASRQGQAAGRGRQPYCTCTQQGAGSQHPARSHAKNSVPVPWLPTRPSWGCGGSQVVTAPCSP